jgi:hypothetical protein
VPKINTLQQGTGYKLGRMLVQFDGEPLERVVPVQKYA